jgi:DNA primase
VIIGKNEIKTICLIIGQLEKEKETFQEKEVIIDYFYHSLDFQENKSLEREYLDLIFNEELIFSDEIGLITSYCQEDKEEIVYSNVGEIGKNEARDY